jgi:hypothetical protein
MTRRWPNDRIGRYLEKKPQADVRHRAVIDWAEEIPGRAGRPGLPPPAELYVPEGEGHEQDMNAALAVLVPWVNAWAAEWARRCR